MAFIHDGRPILAFTDTNDKYVMIFVESRLSGVHRRRLWPTSNDTARSPRGAEGEFRSDYGRGRGFGCGLGVGVSLGTGVEVAVGVAVAVGLGVEGAVAVAVGLGVGVGLGATGTIAYA
jgi:hypothetical protein